MLDRVPGRAPITLVFTRPGELLDRLDGEAGAIGAALPAARSHLDQFATRLRKALGADVSTRLGLKSVGIDVDQPAFLVAGPGRNDAMLINIHLNSRRLFTAWLDRVGADNQKLHDLDGEQVRVIQPESNTPVACLVRPDNAYCQIGLVSEQGPLSLLRAAATKHTRALTQIGDVKSLVTQLPDNGLVYLVVQPKAVGQHLAATVVEHVLRTHRFDQPKARRRAERAARTRAKHIRARAQSIGVSAAALYFKKDRVHVRAEVTLKAAGARWLDATVRTDTSSDPVAQWAAGPALARIMLRLKPGTAQQILRLVGVDLPALPLSGTIAALVLGLDTDTDAAKTGAPRSLEILPFIAPLAAAIGLSGKLPAKTFDLPRGPQPPGSMAVHREARFGSTYEIRADKDVLLLGTGPGSGSTAARRWNRVHQKRGSAARQPFLEIGADLAAIHAAFATGVFDKDTRPELRIADRLQHSLSPILACYRALTVTGRVTNDKRHARFDVELLRASH